MATRESKNIIQKMYVGYYGRPADNTGLSFWADKLEASGGNLALIVDAFGTSDEYTALSTGKTNEQLVNLIFNNLFNRDAEGTVGDTATGLGFFVDKLDSGAITAATIAQNVIDGAKDTDAKDLTAINNKLGVANHFTAAVVNGNRAYGANEIDEGQAVINGVTADPASIGTGKADADSMVGGFPKEIFTIPTGIAKLEAAEGEKAAFLVTADGDEDAGTSATKASLDTELTTAVTAVDEAVEGDYAGGSAAVRAALLTDQKSANATALATAQTSVDGVSGLAEAVTSLKAAEDAAAAGAADELTKQGALDGAIANYNTLHSAKTVAVAVDGTATDSSGALIVLTGGALALADGITEDTAHTGIGAVLATSTDLEATQSTNSSASATVANATLAVNLLDPPATANGDLAAIGGGMTVVTPANAAKPTLAEIESERTGLTDKVTAGITALNTAIGNVTFGADESATEGTHDALTATAVTDGFISADDKTTIDSAFASAQGDDGTSTAEAITASQGVLATNNNLDTAVTSFDALVTAFNAAVAAEEVSNPLLAALDTAGGNVDSLTKLVATETAARVLVDELTTLQNAVDAAETAFEDEGLQVPVTLAAGANAATADSDIFKFGSEDSTISNFNAEGTDTLSTGSGFTRNSGDAATDGDDAVLEVFLSEVSGNTVVTLEQSAFGSNASSPEINTITLTGVALADVSLEGGLLTIPAAPAAEA